MSAAHGASRVRARVCVCVRAVIGLQLERGDVAVFDNTRILHARSSIAPSDGERWVRGCYLDEDGLRLHYERLRRAALEDGRTDWRSLEQATVADFKAMGRAYARAVDNALADNILALLRAQEGVFLGQPVDLLEHGLQTATRALRANEADEVVVASLVHDLTEGISSKNHGGAVAAILEPYVSPATAWMVREHEVFQGYYYFHHMGGDRNARDQLLETVPNASWWSLTERWCRLYDQTSFDPEYPSMPLGALEPLVRRVLSRPPYWWAENAHPKRATVTG